MKNNSQQQSSLTEKQKSAGLPVNFKETSNVPTFSNIIVSVLVASAAITWLGLSRRVPAFQDLTNGLPEKGQLGFGWFNIHGVTFPFEYPYRLDVRNLVSTSSAWICYLFHQSAQFYLIFKAKEAHANGELDWSDKINFYARAMFGLNLFFAALHVLQSHLFYDGLAGSFPEISTLFAGVSSLVVGFMFEFTRRGFIFGFTPESFKSFFDDFCYVVRKYHGYLASFGATLTFWYHVMEGTLSHATGFFHIFLLLVQSSLLFQNAHRNRNWTALLEFWILVHGSIVAYFQGYMQGFLFKMFFASFGLLFLMTVVWGLPAVQSFLKSGNESEKSVKYWGLLSTIVITFTAFSVWFFYDGLMYLPLVFALPGLYYGFTGWYALFYVLGRRLDKYLVENKHVKQYSQIWWVLISSVGVTSILSIMFLSEFIYRLFVPYG
ncbi:hypothetical protein MP638_002917 [Amoeboaphelidium occidentale]|nr:hypothetical protein MP638_002917 [Amoeboaphelidium occidentale]